MLSDQGIDINAGATLTYASGAVASLAWNQVAYSDNRASIAGDVGLIEMHPALPPADRLHRARGDESLETFEEPVIGRGYSHEIIEVAECLRAGTTESALLPQDESLAIMKHLDEILRQLGVAPR